MHCARLCPLSPEIWLNKSGPRKQWSYDSPCLRLSVYLSISLYVYLSLCLSVSLSFCLSVYLSLCLCVSLSICLSVSLSLCLSVYLSICLFVYLSICLSVCLSICLSVLCMFVFCSPCFPGFPKGINILYENRWVVAASAQAALFSEGHLFSVIISHWLAQPWCFKSPRRNLLRLIDFAVDRWDPQSNMDLQGFSTFFGWANYLGVDPLFKHCFSSVTHLSLDR